MKLFIKLGLVFYLFLFFACTNENMEKQKNSINRSVETRSGVNEMCPPYKCVDCPEIVLSVNYPIGNCQPIIDLTAFGHGGVSCKGQRYIDWGDGVGYQYVDDCLQMGCKPFLKHNYTDLILPINTCGYFVIKWKYQYDSSCEGCFGAQASNPLCNPLEACTRVRVCNTNSLLNNCF